MKKGDYLDLVNDLGGPKYALWDLCPRIQGCVKWRSSYQHNYSVVYIPSVHASLSGSTSSMFSDFHVMMNYSF